MTDYLIIAIEGEIEKKATSNLFDAIDIIERLKKAGKTVYVANGGLAPADDFIKRVRALYR